MMFQLEPLLELLAVDNVEILKSRQVLHTYLLRCCPTNHEKKSKGFYFMKVSPACLKADKVKIKKSLELKPNNLQTN